MDLDKTTMERLAFIKYLYREAESQSRKPQPFASSAILGFHDSVELFLQLSSEYLNANKAGNSYVNFMEYWDIIKKELPDDQVLSQKASMRRLNEVRVNLKHQGARPNETDVESLRSATTNFFEDNSEIVFGIEFDDVSLVELIEFKQGYEYLSQAEDLLRDEDLQQALGMTAMAYRSISKEFNKRSRHELGYSPFPHFLAHTSDVSTGNRELERFTRDVQNSFEELSEYLKILSLGTDYRRYSKFQHLTPTLVVDHSDSSGKFKPHLKRHSDDLATRANAKFCIEFVTEFAISLQETELNFESEIEDPNGSLI